MKKLKILIIITCIAIVSLLTVIVIMNIIREDDSNEEIILDKETMGIQEFSEDIIYEVSYSEWLQVNQCINNYLSIINKNNSAYYGRDENNNYVKVIEESTIKKNIYSILSENYIKENEITIKNVYNYVGDITNKQSYTVLKLEKIVNYEYNQYIVQGFIVENEELYGEKSFIVNFNLQESVFSIEPLEGNVDIADIEVKEIEIKKNDYNAIYAVIADKDSIVKEYFNTVKRLILFYPEKAYEYLDEEYKNVKFETFEKFQQHIKDNMNRYSIMYLDRYQKTITNGSTNYVCVDQNGNCYILKEKELIDYTFTLDTYTVDLPEFIEKYDSTTVQGKVVLNIQKIIEALNAKDISYIYSNLAESFKNNKFKTEKSLKQYIEKHLNSNYDVEYDSFKNEGETYIYDIILQDKSTENKTIKMQIIMQLLEDRNFVMSFSIES